MNDKEFLKIVDNQIEQCKSTLKLKGDIYSDQTIEDSDRLVQFKQIAILKGTGVVDALSGCMAKHTTLLYDLMGNWADVSLEQWEETIGDHINYLFLLKAVIKEKMKNEPLG